ncbi:alpha-1,2-mannosyltransferase ktr1 [Maudiozyma exigua]|uniref:Alpha-1,2-mannosyltransferase ktr1 n=1 Tax=Maudiozyma exigua TaxID=34358 RepID=A0A9P7BB37_MAUEX|nr:alpha-1,2-mannosyltransferase ktr1 [Kazachstania exigua]
MAKVSIPKNRELLVRRIGILCITLGLLYYLLNNFGLQYNSNSSRTVGHHEQYVLSGKDGYKYRKVSYEPYTGPKEKATFVTLARNSDLYSLLESIKSVEDRFNSKFQYDWVFLNDEEFTEEFKNVTSALISGQTKYGLVPKEHWSFPSWIDQDKAAAVREEMRAKKIIYGDSISYRHMCRFESGFFYRHPLLDDYDWYWRVEPDIKLHCDINYDVFKFMADNNKKYAFTISIKEYEATIPTLWKTTRDFMALHPEYLPENNMLDFLSDDDGESYNLCHFWSNFEIASLDLWRGEAYSAYFEYLDKAGGFFYERWGDAPVHSIAASLFLERDQIHHFGDLGYYHVPFHQCPIDDDVRLGNRCDCDPKKDFTWHSYSCGSKFYAVNKLPRPDGWQEHSS